MARVADAGSGHSSTKSKPKPAPDPGIEFTSSQSADSTATMPTHFPPAHLAAPAPQKQQVFNPAAYETSTAQAGPAAAPASDQTGGTPGLPDAGGITLAQFMAGIRQVESGGNYAWRSNAQGATGAYQILASNWPEWAQEAGVDPNDHSPAAQDKVAAFKMEQYLKEYGSWDGVAAAWLGGPGGAQAWLSGQSDPADANGTHISQYVANVVSAAKGYAPDVSGGGGSIPNGDQTSPATGSAPSASVASISDADFETGLEQSGFSKALLESVPELKAVFQQAIQQGWNKSQEGLNRFKNALRNTDWFKSRTDSQRAFDEMKASDPTQFKFDMQQAVDKVNQMAGQAGVHLSSDQATGIAQLYFRNGLDDAHVNHYIADYLKMPQEGSNAALTGDAGYYLQKIDALAGQYFAPVTDSMKQDLLRKLIAGTTTEQGLGDYFAKLATSRFPWLADQINAGYTVSQIADPYKARMEQLLGLSADTIDNNDPTLLKGLQMLSPDGKNYQSMPIYQFDQMLRSDPRWKQTPDYVNTQTSVANRLASLLGA